MKVISKRIGKILLPCFLAVVFVASSITYAFASVGYSPPIIETEALDSKTGTHYALAESEVTIIDTVTLSNLSMWSIYGYDFIGTVVDAETGEPIQYKGEDVTVTKTILTFSDPMVVEMVFTFDATDLVGKSVVVTTEVFLNGENNYEQTLATHNDLTNASQTIHFLSADTLTGDSETDEQGVAEPETVAVVTEEAIAEPAVSEVSEATEAEQTGTVEAPEEEAVSVVETGDESNIMLPILLLIVCLLIGGYVLASHKIKSKNAERR